MMHRIPHAALSLSLFACLRTRRAFPNQPFASSFPFLPGTTDISRARVAQNWPRRRANRSSKSPARVAHRAELAEGAARRHTLSWNGESTRSASLSAKMPTTTSAFRAVILVAGRAHVLVVHSSVPVNRSGAYRYGKAPVKAHRLILRCGPSTFAASFRQCRACRVTHLPYKARRPLADLLAVNAIMFETCHQRAASKAQAPVACVTSLQRSATVPDLPTVAESGLPGFDANSWFGILAPAGTPQDIITKLNSEVAKWLASPEAKEKLASQGAIPAGQSPEDFARHIAAETAKWQKVVKESGAKVD